ncbi:MAG: hypothetical protein QG574_3869 [Cyanobacteriota bacterium erpe_2018_sw_21hr_WHONDRS-SW48-000092_B_bin.40]|jgi:hypothetical protein|nr:hypothetical protein [Cyanobacteriota bacterium erpe_2018_sw_21hr_WHONDRS-SW48-000092_B_bin.40]
MMMEKHNGNDFAFLLGAGASEEAGINLSSDWREIIEPLVKDKTWQSGLQKRHKNLSGDSFETGDLNDGEKFVRKLAFLACNDVSYELVKVKEPFGNRADPDAASAFREVAVQLKRVTTVTDSTNLEYLSDLLHFADWRTSPARDGFAHIFTLNYDNTIEETAKRMGYTCLSMPGQVSKQGWFRRNVEIRGINLLKINGSADWSFHKRNTGFGVADTLLQGDAQWLPDAENVGFLDIVDTPWATDLAQVQRTELAERLKETTFLAVLGYSFRRADINEIILEWCRSGKAEQVTIFDPKPSEHHFDFRETCKQSTRCVIKEKTASAAIKSFYR